MFDDVVRGRWPDHVSHVRSLGGLGIAWHAFMGVEDTFIFLTQC